MAICGRKGWASVYSSPLPWGSPRLHARPCHAKARTCRQADSRIRIRASTRKAAAATPRVKYRTPQLMHQVSPMPYSSGAIQYLKVRCLQLDSETLYTSLYDSSTRGALHPGRGRVRPETVVRDRALERVELAHGHRELDEGVLRRQSAHARVSLRRASGRPGTVPAYRDARKNWESPRTP